MSSLASVLEHPLKGGRTVWVKKDVPVMCWETSVEWAMIWIGEKGPLDRALLFTPVMDS